MRKATYGDGTVFQRSKDGRWVARLPYVDDKGSKRRKEEVRKTKREADQALRDLRRLRDAGAPLIETTASVRAYIEQWTTVTLPASGRRESTQLAYASVLKTHVVPVIGDRLMRDVTPVDVEALLLTAAETVSESTVNKVYQVMRVVWATAVRDGLVRRNVVEAVAAPRIPRREAYWYSPQEVAALRQAAGDHRLAPLLDVLAFTGMRIGEALALRWVDVQGDTLRVTGSLGRVKGGRRRDDTKTSGFRAVPLLPEVDAALKARRKAQAAERLAAGAAWTDNGLIFTTEAGTPIHDRNALRWFHGVRAKAGVPDGGFHSFRHAAATALLTAGVPMATVSTIVGHSRISTTVDLYGHVTADHLAAEMRRGLAGYGAITATQSATQSGTDKG